MSIIATIKVTEPTKRSAVVVAMQKRYGLSRPPMKDRRAARGGSRNRQRDYRNENY